MTPRSQTRWLVLALCGALLGPFPAALAADSDRAHPHQGVVEPFPGRPKIAPLDAEQQRALTRGEPILVTIGGTSGGRGMAIQDVHASPETIWGRISAFGDYPRMVPHVEECEIYHADGEDVRVRFVLSVLTLEYEYFIKHAVHTDEGYVTWTLDYTRESDLDDSVGYWAVTSLPDRPGWSRLFYAIDMRTRGWMPSFLRRMIARRGLQDATAWVKRESESQRIRQHANRLAP